MGKANLEIVFDIEADEAALTDMKLSLTESDSALAQLLIDIFQQRLGEREGLETLNVKIPVDRVCIRTPLDGGLSVQEWLEKEDDIDTPLKEHIKEQGFHD